MSSHGSSRHVRSVAWIVFAVALAVRLAWVFSVQRPYDAIYSDMEGYTTRARALLAHTPPYFPRGEALFPYGAHYIYAAIFGTFGYDHPNVVCVVQAILCAIPAWFVVHL